MPHKRQRESKSSILKPLEIHHLRLQKLQTDLNHFLSSARSVFPVSAAKWVGLEEAGALEDAVRRYRKRKGLTERCFLEQVLYPCVNAALLFSALFVSGDEKWLNCPRSNLSRHELFCLVSNSFLCTFEERSFVDDDSMPSINYTEMHCGSSDSPGVEVVKLELLFDYMVHMGKCSEASRKATMTIERTQCPPLAPRDEVVTPLTVRALGESIDDQAHFIRLDFANRWIGGGALADGCVQEEITFAQCPELNALRWNHGPLQDEEAVVVCGHQQYSCIKKGTYGSGIRYGHALTPPMLRDGALLIVDALDYRDLEECTQYTVQAIEREVRKLVSGLSSALVAEYANVAGGNWGCGVFQGDYELKLLIQWLACSVTGKCLHYFPFDLEDVAAFQPLADALCQTGFTTQELYTFLFQLDEEPEDGVWNALVEWFHEARRLTESEESVTSKGNSSVSGEYDAV